MVSRLTLWLVGSFLVACGGAQPATPSPTPTPTDTSAPPATSEAAQNPDAPGKPAGKSVEEHHKDFVGMCNKTPGLDAYCECSWTVFTKNFTPEEMNASDDPTQAKLADFQVKVRDACADKMPESMLKDGFMKGCAQGREGFDDYCECSWPALRKDFSAADLARDDTAKSEKFLNAIKGVAKTCGAKLPEAVLKKSFIAGCTKHGPGTEKFCDCAWKQVRTTMTPGELAMGVQTPAFEAAQKKVHKSCDALMPKDASDKPKDAADKPKPAPDKPKPAPAK